jgi:hypothetical protein
VSDCRPGLPWPPPQPAGKKAMIASPFAEASMLTMLGTPRRCCDGMTRRESLQAGALAIRGGLGLADMVRAERTRAVAQAARGKWRKRKRKMVTLYATSNAAYNYAETVLWAGRWVGGRLNLLPEGIDAEVLA